MFSPKAALRQQLLDARRASASASGQGLLAVAREQAEVVAARRIALYVSMSPEPQTGPLIDWLLVSGREVLLPVLYADNDLGWGLAPGAADLVPGRHGLSEPPVDLGADAITSAELVICPALAVDLSGVRLGRGGGSYDRALARVSPGTPVWAVVHEREILDSLPADPHDRPVHAALTPTRLVRLGL
ncbi:5-formyltetrahydrofolate cyclo-ligase [Kribbella orskensis]|uniref:5-formyltetrahydrofolate cyclo-ligase n=1 Tax=Kribbella orskensis TaxID=2512216 RepID=A0ABY2BCV1_9ACTN|nr:MULTISPECIES: 5-formyltetrahydrofolate cyclo-ligase [Kribbella]TCN35248.1 5-formyltetrahydrofolate cyclo-ligase [Kribbella sp. VKM Ac-2500]TCO16670.1 5-formyltetrahydrofolate cyclo-ligase [Kribbella orskensis]